MKVKFWFSAIALVFTLAFLSAGCARAAAYEVWTIDQADCAKGGAKLYIFKGESLERGEAGTPEVIDINAGAQGVGAGPGVRPHALSFNNKKTHAIIANVASVLHGSHLPHCFC